MEKGIVLVPFIVLILSFGSGEGDGMRPPKKERTRRRTRNENDKGKSLGAQGRTAAEIVKTEKREIGNLEIVESGKFHDVR